MEWSVPQHMMMPPSQQHAWSSKRRRSQECHQWPSAEETHSKRSPVPAMPMHKALNRAPMRVINPAMVQQQIPAATALVELMQGPPSAPSLSSHEGEFDSQPHQIRWLPSVGFAKAPESFKPPQQPLLDPFTLRPSAYWVPSTHSMGHQIPYADHSLAMYSTMYPPHLPYPMEQPGVFPPVPNSDEISQPVMKRQRLTPVHMHAENTTSSLSNVSVPLPNTPRPRRNKLAQTLDEACTSSLYPSIAVPKLPSLSAKLQARVDSESSEFLDDYGFGKWTIILDPHDEEDYPLMIELMRRLYNQPTGGHHIHEFFGPRHSPGRKQKLCSTYFNQLLLLAHFRLFAFSDKKVHDHTQYDVCFDTPALYQTYPNYFNLEQRGYSKMTGTGSGRKLRSGAPCNFTEGLHYFNSKVRAVNALKKHMEFLQSTPNAKPLPKFLPELSKAK